MKQERKKNERETKKKKKQEERTKNRTHSRETKALVTVIVYSITSNEKKAKRKNIA